MTIHKKILIADDDENIIRLLENIAADMDFKSFSATSGKESLQKFKRHRPGVAVIDYKLPDTTGEELVREIKNARPVSQPIVITGYGDYEKAVRVMQAGAADYIKKPFKKDLIKRSISSAYRHFIELRDTTEIYHVLVVTENEELKKDMEKSFPGNPWNISFCKKLRNCFAHLSKHMTDTVVIDLDGRLREGLKLLGSLKKFYKNIHVAVMSGNGDEDTVVEAIRLGADEFIRSPGDLKRIPEMLHNALKALEIKRICNLKRREIEKHRSLTARITEISNINIELFADGAKKTYTFARRLLDNIPVCVAVADEKKRVVYANRFFKRNAGKLPEKIDKKFKKVLENIGIKDVPLEIIDREMDNLISSGHEIETVTLGKNEYLTLTNLNVSLIPAKEIKAVLIVAVGR